MKNGLRGHAALLAANLIFGVNYAVSKGMMPKYFEPFPFIFYRVAGALILFWFFHAVTMREKVQRRDLGLMFICGFFGVAANQLMFLYGLNLTTPINAALIMTGNPVLVLIAAAWILRERITATKVLGIVLGLTGAAWLILSKSEVALTAGAFIGDLFIFMNACAYAIYLVLVKPLMRKYRPLTVIKWVFLFGFIVVLPFGLPTMADVQWSQFTAGAWASLVFVIVGATFIAYLLNVYALKHLSPSIVSIYIYIQPVVATIIALFMGQDRLTWDKVVSAVLIFTGVYFASMRNARNGAARVEV